MTTNPCASPAEIDDPTDHAEQEVHSIICTFPILAIFSITVALFACYAMFDSMFRAGGTNVAKIILMAVHTAMIGFLCFRKLGRYYPAYCRMIELRNAEGLADLDAP